MELFPGLTAFTPFTVIIAISTLMPLATAKSGEPCLGGFQWPIYAEMIIQKKVNNTRKCQMTLNMVGKKEMLFDSDCTLWKTPMSSFLDQKNGIAVLSAAQNH